MERPIIIGIAGGTGSGKTTLSKRIVSAFRDDVLILCHDSYYKSNDQMPLEERVLLNYDHPNAFDTELMIEDLKKLKNRLPIDCPVYSFVLHNRTKETIHIQPKNVIIVEGILIFENKELREMMDMKIFVDTDADLRLIRRLLRDVQERGRDLESVVRQYTSTVKPMHEEFVEPSKRYADIIVPEGGYNRVALEMIVNRIEAIIKEYQS